MGEKFALKQISEGSLLFNQAFGVDISWLSRQHYKFIYKMYEDGILQETTQLTPSNIYYYKPKKYGIYKIIVEVYEEDKKIETLIIPILDFHEDFVLIKETSIQYENGEIFVEARTELNLPKEYYAFYLKRNNNVVEKIFYTKQPWWRFRIEEIGEYSVQVFVRLIKNSGVEDKVITHTETIKVEQL